MLTNKIFNASALTIVATTTTMAMKSIICVTT